MIQRTAAGVEPRSGAAADNWQTLLSDSVTTPEALLGHLGLSPELWLAGARAGHALFPVRVPAPYLSRIRHGDPHDPLLRQVLPLLDETTSDPAYVQDPLAEDQATATTGLIRKYHNRALLMVTGQCAINCRYCFRRHFPYAEHRLSPADRDHVIDTLAAAPEIREVILSGGDPLVASDRLLAEWAERLAGLPHVRRLRLHTRLPVVIPQRVTDALLQWLQSSRLQTVMVLHINHPAEIDVAVRQAMLDLRRAGVTLLNQSVLLRGVNDDAGILAQLSESLFDAGILPYYLHGFDPVAGAGHFDGGDDRGRAISRELLQRLPGFLVPRLVREVPGAASKVPLDLRLA